MFFSRSIRILMSLLLLPSCSNINDQPVQTTNKEYCDQYFVYQMCVRDISNNGKIDLMYFSDTNEIFMLVKNASPQYFSDLKLHECVQIMDSNLRKIGSKLLSITEQTTFFERAKLKSKLMIAYADYRLKIESCHQPELAIPEAGTDFNEDDEFGEL